MLAASLTGRCSRHSPPLSPGHSPHARPVQQAARTDFGSAERSPEADDFELLQAES